MREDGWYWVVPTRGIKEVALWLKYAEKWLLCGSTKLFVDSDFKLIGSKIDPTTEWQQLEASCPLRLQSLPE
jgi:hypothetical protein